MLIPGQAYRSFREAFRRGDRDTVLGTAQQVLDQAAGGELGRQPYADVCDQRRAAGCAFLDQVEDVATVQDAS